ncbi:hypothetical protein ACJJIF_20740 [Microbulbifer sp. SSSA002]|uniref:hypothetical protein n=1 Tax=Microbulbifer sp. SSSA002 TaxID=3243376 RepID=UPI004039C710
MKLFAEFTPLLKFKFQFLAEIVGEVGFGGLAVFFIFWCRHDLAVNPGSNFVEGG